MLHVESSALGKMTTERCNRSVDVRLVGGDLLLLGSQLPLLLFQGLGLGLQFSVLLFQLLFVSLGLHLGFMQTSLDGLSPLQIVPWNLTTFATS